MTEQEVDSVIDSIVFAKKAINGRPPESYWKGETHTEDS